MGGPVGYDESAAARPAGWYADPWVRGQRRYWSGDQWTADVFADGSRQQADTSFIARYGPPPTTPAQPPPPPPQFRFEPPAPAVRLSQETPTAAPSSWQRPALILGVVAALVLVSGAALLLRQEDPRPTARPAATASPAPTSPAPTSPTPGPSQSQQPEGTIQSVLEALVLHQRDVPDAFTVAPIPGGRSATDQPTLDLCAATYPSESQRIGRLQVSARNRSDQTTLSTEAVQYRDEAGPEQAFAEVQQVASQCQEEVSLGTGAPVRTTVTAGADQGWGRTAGVERLAYTVSDTDLLGGGESQQVVVYLRRGPLLMGLYFPAPQGRQMPVEGQTRIPDIVEIFEKRLLDTPPGDPAQGLPEEPDPQGAAPGIGA